MRDALPEAPPDAIEDSLDVDGVRLAYRLQGEGPRELVCIHGVGSYLEAWQGAINALGGGFRVLSFDLRGHGRSERVKGRYEIDDFVGDVLALADHAGFARFDLAGFSLGGLIAQRLALTHPARLRRLVLLATVAGRTAEERARVAERLAALQAGERGAHYDASLSRWLTEDFQARHPALVDELRRRNARNDPDCYAAAYRVLAQTDFGGLIDQIAMPTLIATGECDAGSNPRMARYMHERIPDSRLAILPNLRHSLLNEAPEQVAALMRAFLIDSGEAAR
ncbi:alpha/beta fold hydrolase [Burkholderia gladioli]|jgi:pimeloyl-ACP methyl ester carboxylesterase|uniref:Alpha/beta hydrolase fold family protein n=2 Tax=Burkholderia gladioli TaxID=28095 RepID=A0AAW3F0H5_BURGA|nr:alpha/beta hydrolase [Burkholderia gladioli]AJW94925.1 alpha/beta hydrolase fold family protein [Burkholderia gladioli]ASD81533.1 alpha/beta hydrolase [Burkholderia gladioli pv. gladioli]AWY51792.1 alpha/beta hydrolase [Burkholderia gladioli pv. gladioli]KGC13931.1 alpha/beta hydrolase fold family protein [Burkholderia gladioli]MDJ1165938.1 alpha/beta hydrolase [Burkholderia gladioli pv. gladioli]